MPAPSLSRALRIAVLAIVGGACLDCGSPRASPPAVTTPETAPASASAAPSSIAPVQVEMRNLRLHVGDGVVLDVRHLRGEMRSRTPNPPVFDDPQSYVLHVFVGDLSMDMASLANLLNRHVFAYEHAPLKDLSVEIDNGMLEQKGKMHKAVWLPFSMKAIPSVTPDGRLKLHTESVRALGIPATKLLDLFGLTLDDLIDVERQRGVEIKGDDIILSAGRVLPPPRIEGHLLRVELANGRLRQVFGPADGRAPSPLTPPDRQARNYFYFSGSVIKFGKLTMTGSDLQLIDADERDPFDFHPARYNEQLVAGYSKNTASKGLKTYMPDFSDLKPGFEIRPGGR